MKHKEIPFVPMPMVDGSFSEYIPENEHEQDTITAIIQTLSEYGISIQTSFDSYISDEGKDNFKKTFDHLNEFYNRRFLGAVNSSSVREDVVREINKQYAQNTAFNRYLKGTFYPFYHDVLYKVTIKVIKGKFEIERALREVVINLLGGFAAAKYITVLEKISKGNITQDTEICPKKEGEQTLGDNYETESLKAIFFPEAIEKYIEIENGFIADGWIKDNQWQKEKNMLVSLILILDNRGYLKPIRGTNKRTRRLAHRDFFEARYDIDISKQMQPGIMERFELPDAYALSFQFIRAIN